MVPNGKGSRGKELRGYPANPVSQHRERFGATGFDQQIVGLLWLFMMVMISAFEVIFSLRDNVKLKENSNLFFGLHGTAITTWDAKKTCK